MDFKSNIPIYLQVIEDIERKIIIGEIELGSKLPSSRELALQYQINPNTAARVYNELEQRKLSFTKRGIGTFVTEDAEVIETAKKELVTNILQELLQRVQELGIHREEFMSMIDTVFSKENEEKE